MTPSLAALLLALAACEPKPSARPAPDSGSSIETLPEADADTDTDTDPDTGPDCDDGSDIDADTGTDTAPPAETYDGTVTALMEYGPEDDWHCTGPIALYVAADGTLTGEVDCVCETSVYSLSGTVYGTVAADGSVDAHWVATRVSDRFYDMTLAGTVTGGTAALTFDNYATPDSCRDLAVRGTMEATSR